LAPRAEGRGQKKRRKKNRHRERKKDGLAKVTYSRKFVAVYLPG
jgi:hypothetical protein